MQNPIDLDDRLAGLDATIDRVAAAQRVWAMLVPRARADRLRLLRHRIVAHQKQLGEVIAAETSKPITEAIAQEITATLGMIRFMELNYPTWLQGRRFRYLRPGFWRKSNVVRYDPLGTVLVIGPANFPFSLVVMQACSALLCGDGVIIKPSERCPETALLLERLFEADDVPVFPVAVVQGGAQSTGYLVRHQAVDKVLFTGSSEVGVGIAEICGRHFKPCVLELGGNGIAIVLPDADLRLAARGLIWSALYTNAQSCIGTRNVLVQPGTRDRLTEELDREFGKLRRGAPGDPSTDLSEGFNLNLHEVLRVTEVDTVEDAISTVNSSPFGLSASVWSRDVEAAQWVAGQLRVGMVWVNDSSVGLPEFPWGGVRQSGWGRLFSRESIVELTQCKVISTDRGRSGRRKPWWYPYSTEKLEVLQSVNRFLYGPDLMNGFRETVAAVRRYLSSDR